MDVHCHLLTAHLVRQIITEYIICRQIEITPEITVRKVCRIIYKKTAKCQGKKKQVHLDDNTQKGLLLVSVEACS